MKGRKTPAFHRGFMMKKMILILMLLSMMLVLVSCLPNDECDDDNTLSFQETSSEENVSNEMIDKIDIGTKGYFEIPEGWTMISRGSGYGNQTKIMNTRRRRLGDIIDLKNENGDFVGAVGYGEFEVADKTENEVWKIYEKIAFEEDYRFIIETSNENKENGFYVPYNEHKFGVTAMTKVFYSDELRDEMGYADNDNYNVGILSYNNKRGAFIAMEFDEAMVSEEEIKLIADSIHFENYY